MTPIHRWLLALALATFASACITDLTELRRNARPPERDAGSASADAAIDGD